MALNPLQALLMRGLHGLFPASDAEIIREIADGVKHHRLRVFVSETSAFAIVTIPQNKFDYPQVLHFYSEKKGLRTALVARVLAFVRNLGYNKLQAINGSGVDDEIWTRAFRHEGWEIKPVKTVFEFEAVA